MAEFIVGNSLRKLARENGFLQRLLWRLDFALVWLLARAFRLLPVDTASRWGSRVGAWVGARMKRKTAIFRENMALAFPELDDAALDELVTRAWGQAGRVLAEYPHLDTILEEEERLVIDIREAVPTYQPGGPPSVFVSAHLGNWEICCSALAKLGIPNASLYSPPTNPLLDRLLLDSRRALNCELLPRDNSARLLMRALKTGRSPGMVMDRRVDDGQPIRFFGHDKNSTLLPAKLALKHHCELIPIQVERLRDARFRVTFHPPVRPANPGADENARARDMIEQVHRQFEDWIRQSPQDWFCSKRLWPKGTTAQQHEVTGNDAEVDSYAA